VTSLLAIDASKYVGWAYFRDPADKPLCRTWVADGLWDSDDYGPYFAAFEGWLRDMLVVHRPGVFAFESPIVASRGGWGKGRGSDENNVRRLIGIVSVAELVCARRGLRCMEVNNKSAKAFAGVSRFKDKDGMVVAMTALGYEVGDSHQSDACAIARVVYSQLGELDD
jgi:hypothetical protein